MSSIRGASESARRELLVRAKARAAEFRRRWEEAGGVEETKEAPVQPSKDPLVVLFPFPRLGSRPVPRRDASFGVDNVTFDNGHDLRAKIVHDLKMDPTARYITLEGGYPVTRQSAELLKDTKSFRGITILAKIDDPQTVAARRLVYRLELLRGDAARDFRAAVARFRQRSRDRIRHKTIRVVGGTRFAHLFPRGGDALFPGIAKFLPVQPKDVPGLNFLARAFTAATELMEDVDEGTESAVDKTVRPRRNTAKFLAVAQPNTPRLKEVLERAAASPHASHANVREDPAGHTVFSFRFRHDKEFELWKNIIPEWPAARALLGANVLWWEDDTGPSRLNIRSDTGSQLFAVKTPSPGDVTFYLSNDAGGIELWLESRSDMKVWLRNAAYSFDPERPPRIRNVNVSRRGVATLRNALKPEPAGKIQNPVFVINSDGDVTQEHGRRHLETLLSKTFDSDPDVACKPYATWKDAASVAPFPHEQYAAIPIQRLARRSRVAR